MAFILLKKKLMSMSWMKFLYLTEDCLAIDNSFIKFNVAIKVCPEVIENFLAYLVHDQKSIQGNGIYDFYCKGQEAQASNFIKKLLANEKTFLPFHAQSIRIGMSIDREDTQKNPVYPKNSQSKQKMRCGKNFEIEILFEEREEENKTKLQKVHINFHIQYEKGRALSESIFSLENIVNYFMSVYSKTKEELIELDLENFKQLGYQVAKKSILALIRYREKNCFPTELDFTDYPLRASGINYLAAALPEWKTLQKLNLKDSQIENEGLKLLVSGLGKNTHLLTLELENNGIEMEGINALSDFLEKNVALTHLDLSNNPLGFTSANILFLALQKNTALQELRLGDVQLGDQGILDLANFLKKNETLTLLSLKNNEITSVGIKTLGFALENKKIRALDLGGNNFSLEGMNALMPALQKNNTLTFLQLCRNKIISEGAKVIADFLAINTTLITLNLRSNQLGSVGSHVIALSLGKNTTLKCLNINHNQIGESLVNDVIFILEHNTALMVMDILGNGLGDHHVKTMIPALERNTTLQVLQVLHHQKKFNAESKSPKNAIKKILVSLLSRNIKFSEEKAVHREEKSVTLNLESSSEFKAAFSSLSSLEKTVPNSLPEKNSSMSQTTSKPLSKNSFPKTLPLSTSSRPSFFQEKEAPNIFSYSPASFSETLMPMSYPNLFFPAEFYGDSRDEKILKELKRITASEWKRTNDFFYSIAENKTLAENICAHFKGHHIGVVLKNQRRIQIKNVSLEVVQNMSELVVTNQCVKI